MISGTRYRLTMEIARQSQLSQDIARAQSDISSGKRLQTPSDDPAASARAAEIRRTQANQAVWASNVEAASALAAQVDTTLTGVGTAIDRARELMLAASSGTLADSDRAAIAVELRGIAEDIHSFAATTDSRDYPLFPAGDALEIPIAKSVRVAATSSRSVVFDTVQTADGPMSLSQIISAAADAIALPERAARTAASTTALAAIEEAGQHISSVRGEHGVRAARIDGIRERLVATGLLLEEERGALEGTDLSATVATVNAKMLTLQAAQATFARVNRSTLFDLLG
jgi:flagellar hook-associated protein 3 FlgL